MNDENQIGTSMKEGEDCILALRQEVRRLRLMVLTLVVASLAVLVVANLIVCSIIPHTAVRFEQVLGDRNKLPRLTNCVLSYGESVEGLLAITLVVVVPLGASILYLLFPRAWWALPVLVGAILFLLAHWLVISLAIKMPYHMVIGPLMPLP